MILELPDGTPLHVDEYWIIGMKDESCPHGIAAKTWHAEGKPFYPLCSGEYEAETFATKEDGVAYARIPSGLELFFWLQSLPKGDITYVGIDPKHGTNTHLFAVHSLIAKLRDEGSAP